MPNLQLQKFNLSLESNPHFRNPTPNFHLSLAKILDQFAFSKNTNPAKSGPLQKYLENKPTSTLRDAIFSLNLLQRKQRLSSLSHARLEELLSISNESPKIFWERLHHVGQELVREGKNGFAVGILNLIASPNPNHSTLFQNDSRDAGGHVGPPLRLIKKAQATLHLRQGHGTAWQQLELFSSRFFDNTFSLTTIVPMMGATMIGKATTTWALGRLAIGSRVVRLLPPIFQRGLGARFAANSFALAIEGPAFAMMGMGLRPPSFQRPPKNTTEKRPRQNGINGSTRCDRFMSA